ncbi:MAG: tRNA preQ1(34) S-adenosylmethionine ribosyltransferase-isomerase QueA [Planctomycetota bacterium]
MRTADFAFELPEELVAQRPAARREDARLLVSRATSTEHGTVSDLVRVLEPGDLLVVNDTRVRRARIVGRRASGGRVECLLTERIPGASSRWRAMCRPAAKLRAGEPIVADGVEVVPLEREVRVDGSLDPCWIVALREPGGGEPKDEEALVERAGSVPLPPYVHREGGADEEDAERYQTVFARELGAVAAPTAGLHLSRALLDELSSLGVRRASVTLHVGPGTFRPVDVEDARDHTMHVERYEVPLATREAIAATRANGGRVVAVGTTVVRTLEAARDASDLPRAGAGETDLFLAPGDAIRSVDALLTNFHLPRSTLLMLVCAFAGTERVLALYREAVERRYRFYSFGDAMLLLR